ncbi:uncharacterized protein LOC124270253 [Haliotis rubra]|uniref:uncharacterized protein LOC124270253 n=1 Tax=Haliotis rubra TaxID=36100 RepID=UPI001EE4FD0A|nr:uncharacterized protein LOC124270253 [Haliotis rubra]
MRLPQCLPPAPVLPQGVEAPPTYEEVMGSNQSSVIEGQPELPPLAYIDIMPRILNVGNMRANIAPVFQKFSDIMQGANMWLQANPGLQCWKCETVERKVDKGPYIDLDSMKMHQSTYGFNVYVLGLRMWLTRKQNNSPPQQLGLKNVVPATKEVEIQAYQYGNMFHNPQMHYWAHRRATDVITTFEGLSSTIDTLNEDLKKSPLQGSVINIETANIKYSGFATDRDPEKTSFVELGANRMGLFRRNCQIIRIFYVLGEPKHEEIHMKDIVPDIVRHSGLVGSAVFEPFSGSLLKAQMWLQQQSGIKIVNIETRDVRSHENMLNLETTVNSDSTDDFDGTFWACKYVKILRMFYVKSPEMPSYASTKLTSRLFPPLRLGIKTFETMSQTMIRIAAWLSVTRLPIFGVETVHYPFIDNDNIGFNPERSDHYTMKNMGRTMVTAIRLYFPTYYEEPPRHMLPPTIDWLTQGEGRGTSICTIL